MKEKTLVDELSGDDIIRCKYFLFSYLNHMQLSFAHYKHLQSFFLVANSVHFTDRMKIDLIGLRFVSFG